MLITIVWVCVQSKTLYVTAKILIICKTIIVDNKIKTRELCTKTLFTETCSDDIIDFQLIVMNYLHTYCRLSMEKYVIPLVTF